MNIIKSIFRDNMFRKDDLQLFVSKFYYEGSRRKQYLVRFGVLTVLSAVIAAYGVLDDSTATVIGAMIIAPLMMPIMAMATALVMGRMDHATKSFITVVVGSMAVILVSWFIAETYFGYISLESNTQIISRVQPNITALFVALASGAVAAFAMSRDDINDSLPGAAIAIALVPPLAVVGICLAVENMTMASGAFLLFLTNFLSIIVAGSLVFHLLGLSNIVTKRIQEEKARHNAFLIIGIGVLLVTIPLIITTKNIVETATTSNKIQAVLESWIDGTSYRLEKLNVAGDSVDITITGEGDIMYFDKLVNEIKIITSEDVIITLNAIQSQYWVHPAKEDTEQKHN